MTTQTLNVKRQAVLDALSKGPTSCYRICQADGHRSNMLRHIKPMLAAGQIYGQRCKCGRQNELLSLTPAAADTQHDTPELSRFKPVFQRRNTTEEDLLIWLFCRVKSNDHDCIAGNCSHERFEGCTDQLVLDYRRDTCDLT